jgi:hypothetical protein
MKDGRIPTWGVILMLVASLIGSWLLLKDLLSRYKKQWPW